MRTNMPRMEKNTNIYLLQHLALIDDQKAFTLFFNSYYDRLIRFAKLLVADRSIAEDTVSEVLIRLLGKREQLFFIENFEGYLFLAVKNEALNHLKSVKVKRMISFQDTSQQTLSDRMDPHEKLIGHELRHCVYEVIERLPPKRKMVYKLVKDEGLRYKDVAGIMAISQRTVEVHLKIAVSEVRNAVVRHFSEAKILQ